MTSQPDIKMKNGPSKYAFIAELRVASGLNGAVGMYILLWKFDILSVVKGERQLIVKRRILYLESTKSTIFNVCWIYINALHAGGGRINTTSQWIVLVLLWRNKTVNIQREKNTLNKQTKDKEYK